MNTTKTQTLRAITIGAAVALGFAAAVASAGTTNSQLVGDGVNQNVVRFPDLDLSKIEGVAALYNRLHSAAQTVCDSLQSREPGMAAKYRACVDHAIADAVAKVNRPLMAQYYESRISGPKTTVVQLAKAN